MKLGLIAFVLTIGLASCTPPMYIPESVHVADITSKGKSEINLTTGTNGIDLQLAHAITDNIGVMTSVSGTIHNDSIEYHHRITAQGGINYVNQLENNGRMLLFFHCYTGGGYGFGEGLDTYSFYSSYYENWSRGEYMRFFTQPSIQFKGEFIDLFVGSRISYIQFNSLENKWGYVEGINDPNGGKTQNIYIEPNFTFRAGGDHLKGHLQLGYSQGVIAEMEMKFRRRPVLLNVGLSISF